MVALRFERRLRDAVARENIAELVVPQRSTIFGD